MKKSLFVLFVLVSLVVVGCGKGASGFDKPEDLAAKVAECQNNADYEAILDFTHFAKPEDKAKVKAFYDATADVTKKLMDMVKKQLPEANFAYKENKVEGDKGQIVLTTPMGDLNMEIVKVEGKWLLNSSDKFFADALTKDPKEALKEMEENLKQAEEAMKHMPKPE